MYTRLDLSDHQDRRETQFFDDQLVDGTEVLNTRNGNGWIYSGLLFG